jgi:hypothetical protein
MRAVVSAVLAVVLSVFLFAAIHEEGHGIAAALAGGRDVVFQIVLSCCGFGFVTRTTGAFTPAEDAAIAIAGDGLALPLVLAFLYFAQYCRSGFVAVCRFALIACAASSLLQWLLVPLLVQLFPSLQALDAGRVAAHAQWWAVIAVAAAVTATFSAAAYSLMKASLQPEDRADEDEGEAGAAAQPARGGLK